MFALDYDVSVQDKCS